jgi:hypothetical protein
MAGSTRSAGRLLSAGYVVYSTAGRGILGKGQAMTTESKPKAGRDGRQIVAETLGKVVLGEPLSHGNLDIIPLFIGNGHALPYLLLRDAIEAGVLQITEVSEGGNVPRLKVVNTSDHPVLILAGDELIGAKQNRIVNISIIVAKHTEMPVPVSCVERGRWAYRTKCFAAGRKANFRLRREMTRDVRSGARVRGEYHSDQGKVWDEVDKLHSELKSKSSTGAMGDSYDNMEADLSAFKERLTCPDDATGFAAFINGELVALELFNHPEVLKKVWTSHVESYAIDALRQEPAKKPGRQPGEMVEECSRQIADALEEPRPSVGRGYDIGVERPGLVGSALVDEGRLVHLQAFLGSDPEGQASPDEISCC